MAKESPRQLPHVEPEFPQDVYELMVNEAVHTAIEKWHIVESSLLRRLFNTYGIVADSTRPWHLVAGISATRYLDTANRVEMIIEICDKQPMLKRVPPGFEKLWVLHWNERLRLGMAPVDLMTSGSLADLHAVLRLVRE